MTASLPVAEVLVDLPLAHLDRPFDYLVPATLEASAQPGARVRVRFAGRQVGGYILRRKAASDHPGRLSKLSRVVSAEPVLTPELATLIRAVADRYAGTAADVLRLAIPPRHARVEKEASPGPQLPPPAPVAGEWERYATGREFLTALTDGRGPRAVWTALPGSDWAAQLATAAAATAAGGRGALLVVADGRDADRLDAALRDLVGTGQHLVLTADLGPAERYRRWLAALRGSVRIVVGTRASVFAPVQRLGLVAIWDDGNDVHAEPRAPYPHAREVLLLRAHEAGCAALVGGYARTAEGSQLLATGWAHALVAHRRVTRQAAPVVRTVDDDVALARDAAARAARLPTLAWRAAREGLRRGPVLVQVPRAGYVPALACQDCRTAARCPNCNGPLGQTGSHATASCGWCGRLVVDLTCAVCGSRRWRARRTGALRTAEELGRAFPGVSVQVSGRDALLNDVDDTPALVVATPGAEPRAAGGYAAVLLLDGWLPLARPSLRAAEEAVRRWLNAAALVRSGDAGGQVVLVAESSARAVQAVVRWDPDGFAERELAERAQLHFPPAARVAELEGSPCDVSELLESLSLPDVAEVLGPVVVPAAMLAAPGEDGERHRFLLRVPRSYGLALAANLHAAQATRSARKTGGPVRVRIDPVDLG